MWDLKIIDTDKSLYIAVAEALERDIHLGILKPGDKLPTQRELAIKVGVTLTTISRAYAEAERKGLITAVVGSGTFVASDLGKKPYHVQQDIEKRLPIEMGILHPLYEAEDDFRHGVNLLSQDQGNLNKLSQYVPPNGLLEHREIGAKWIKRYYMPVEPENVIVTAGAQHGLNCVFSALFDQEDRIAVDYLTYPGIKSAARLNNIILDGVMMDEEGMIPSHLEQLCKRNKIHGIYTVGGIQNPTNYAMSSKRRKEIAAIIKKYQLLLIEDDMYPFLSDNNRETLSQYIPDQSIYLSSLSKAFYIGLRTAFIAAPKRFVSQLSQAIVDSMWMVSPISTELACRIITSGLGDKIVNKKRDELALRVRMFKEIFPDQHFSVRDRSMFIWLKLPKPYTSSAEFEKKAEESGLHVYGADKFSIGHFPVPNYVRLSISSLSSRDEYEKGLFLLHQLL